MWHGYATSASEFSEICNGKVPFVTKCKDAFWKLFVISYDSVVITFTAEN